MYPTRRMIFVALLGIPLALAAAVIAPSLWFLGCVWILFCVGLFILDAVFAASPSRATVTLHVPEVIGVGREQGGRVEVAFKDRPPVEFEVAVDADERLQARLPRRGHGVSAGAGIAH